MPVPYLGKVIFIIGIYHYLCVEGVIMKDQLGVVCSGLCIVHCLATPVILGLGLSGIFASVLTAELFHLFLLVPIVLLIMLTVPKTYQRYGSLSLVLTAVTGLLMLISALFLSEDKEVLFTVVGGSLLVTFHLWNLRLQYLERKDKVAVTEAAS